MKTIRQKNLQWLWLTVLIIILDRVTKYVVSTHLQWGDSTPVIDHLNIVLAYNRGAAFSFLSSSSGWQLWLFSAIAFLVSFFVVIWLWRTKTYHRVTAIALALIVGGALGNVIDRLLYGHVIDFIDVYVGSWHWPAFNVADSSVCVGAVLMILSQVLGASK